MTFERKTIITPDIARALLTLNTGNRKLTPGVVERYAEDMRKGLWVFNGDAIRQSVSGRILDGQHRLHAVIKSGVSITVMLITGLSEDVFATIDNGKPRKFRDIIQGEKNVTTLGAVCVFIHQAKKGYQGNGGTPSNTGKQQILQEHPEIRGCVEAASKLPRYLNHPVQAYVYYVASLINKEKAEEWMNGLTTGESLGSQDARLVLRERMGSSGKYLRADRYRALALTIKAWNAFSSGKGVGILTYGHKREAYPKFIFNPFKEKEEGGI